MFAALTLVQRRDKSNMWDYELGRLSPNYVPLSSLPLKVGVMSPSSYGSAAYGYICWMEITTRTIRIQRLRNLYSEGWFLCPLLGFLPFSLLSFSFPFLLHFLPRNGFCLTWKCVRFSCREFLDGSSGISLSKLTYTWRYYGCSL